MFPSPLTFQNWAGTVRATYVRREAPTREDELVAALKRAARDGLRVRPFGSGHSWSAVAAPQGVGLDLSAMNRVLGIDRERLTVRVQAGISLYALNAALDEAGLAMPILGSVGAQSVAGAVSTGTHGSSVHHGNLASLVVKMRLVRANADVLELSSEQPDLFAAARVSLGALGVLSELTLRVIPAFRLEETTRALPLPEAIATAPELLASAQYAKLWWLPHTEQAILFTARPTDAPITSRRGQRALDAAINRFVFTPLLAWGARARALVPPTNRLVGLGYLRPTRRVDRSDQIFHLVTPPSHREAEAAVPLERAGAALGALAERISRDRLPVGFIQELRAVAADDAWLSPAYGRATAQLGAYIPHSPHADAFFSAFEEAMAPFDPRPHWGKELRATPTRLRAAFPRYDDFLTLRERLDPVGTFDSPALANLFPRAGRAR